MTSISIIGVGNMGSAIASIAVKGGAEVQLIARDAEKGAAAAVSSGATAATYGDALTGDVVVLALPYPAIAEVLATYGSQLSGKTIVDISNPVDFFTFDSLVTPADGSAAHVISRAVPGATVLKAFNTTFAATLGSGQVGGLPTTVLIVGDDTAAKAELAAVIQAGGVGAIDAGSLKRARELEAMGFLQLTLAATEKVGWASGFAVVK